MIRKFGSRRRAKALLADDGPNDQRKASRHPEGVIKHQLRKTIGDRLEVEGTNRITKTAAQHLLEGRNDRSEVSGRAEKTEGLKIAWPVRRSHG